MKAMLCTEYGPPEKLVLTDVPSEQPGRGQIKIGVQAAGVNFPDVLIIKGEYQFKPTPPFAPGAEVSGDVLAVGEGVTDFQPGDRVIGMTGWNGFAEEVNVDATRCLAMPASMSYETGAAFSMTYGTSYHALVQRGRLAQGETLLVLGATGGVGTAAIEIGRLLGAKLIAAGGDDTKLDVVKRQYGVEHVVNYRTGSLKDQVKTLTNGQGADVIYDAVGGDLFEQSLRSINWDGRLLVVGFASGTIPQAKANLVLLKGCAIVGVFWGAFTAREPAVNRQNFAQLFRWHDEGKLKPHISHRFPLARAADALAAIVNREVVGKAILTM
ncbi:MAG TPA: NADPH:quinone oxidoreductase family protein [Polyangiaceae bacterium]|jgi:NADPH2:quinone reductase|nr:NADPH:quinone oxidoreductase family protein [Polyangiaceae bacterium]